jgi:hypothetical protein
MERGKRSFSVNIEAFQVWLSKYAPTMRPLHCLKIKLQCSEMCSRASLSFTPGCGSSVINIHSRYITTAKTPKESRQS